MPKSTLRAAVLGLLAAVPVAIASGCNGCGGMSTRAITCHEGDCCHTNQDCYNLKKNEHDPNPKNWFCLVATETCLPLTKTCKDDGQCCPGQTCSLTLGECVDTYTQCSDDSSCNVAAGQYCDNTLGSYPQGSGCTYQTCNPTNGNADCAQGLTCFDSYCLDQPPCNGGCPAGSVCTPVNGFCFKLDNPSASCQQTCVPGTILVFQDGLNVFNQCNPAEKADCACDALPPLQSDNTVLFSDSTVAGSNILVSAYDYEYGDLVMHTFDKATLTETKVEWIDGVPANCAPTWDTAGPRTGCAVAGPDVGRYTSIAYDAKTDTTHIAYYGVSNGTTPLTDLRYASRSGTSPWTIVVVDGYDPANPASEQSGDVGRYTSITVSPDDAPVISYFQAAGPGQTLGTTAVKVARGTVPQPTTAAEFKISVVESEQVTPPPCSLAPCTSAQTCVEQTGSADGACVTNATGCANPACSSSQICGKATGASAACFTPLVASELPGLPPGDGLFTGIAYLGSDPVVVWYDNTVGRLKGAIATSDSPSQGANFTPGDIAVLDDGNGFGSATPHDVGRYASIVTSASGSTAIAVAYVDETARQLDLITADDKWQNLTPPGAGRIVDTGIVSSTPAAADPILFVGSDASVQFFGGLIFVGYQDQTGLTFRVATQASASVPVAFAATLAADGAGGFYGRLATDGTNLFASQAIIQATSGSTSGNKLSVLKVR